MVFQWNVSSFFFFFNSKDQKILAGTKHYFIVFYNFSLLSVLRQGLVENSPNNQNSPPDLSTGTPRKIQIIVII